MTPPAAKPTSSGYETRIPLPRCPDIELVAGTPKGRGVFATNRIPAHTVIDVSPVLVLDPRENEEHVSHTRFFFYTYNWPLAQPKPLVTNNDSPSSSSTTTSSSNQQQPYTPTQALPLGLGSLFNHSTYHQNIGWKRDVELQTITYTTLRDIEAGEELCISYGEPRRLGFKDADGEVIERERKQEESRGLEGILLGIEDEEEVQVNGNTGRTGS